MKLIIILQDLFRITSGIILVMAALALVVGICKLIVKLGKTPIDVRE